MAHAIVWLQGKCLRILRCEQWECFLLGRRLQFIYICLPKFANQHNSDFPIISGQQEGGYFNLFEQSGYPSGRLINPSVAQRLYLVILKLHLLLRV